VQTSNVVSVGKDSLHVLSTGFNGLDTSLRVLLLANFRAEKRQQTRPEMHGNRDKERVKPLVRIPSNANANPRTVMVVPAHTRREEESDNIRCSSSGKPSPKNTRITGCTMMCMFWFPRVATLTVREIFITTVNRHFIICEPPATPCEDDWSPRSQVSKPVKIQTHFSLQRNATSWLQTHSDDSCNTPGSRNAQAYSRSSVTTVEIAIIPLSDAE
jgi:hypothetical protein